MLILVLHIAWIVWMISGIALMILGFWRNRFWQMPIFRTTHLLALIATATVPLWNNGQCPLTQWEAGVDPHDVSPLMIRICETLLYWDVSPLVLSLLTASAAILTLVVYFWRPPWRPRHLQSDRLKAGQEDPGDSNSR